MSYKKNSNIQQISLFAYEEVKTKKQTRHEQIIRCFKKFYPNSLNNRQISELTGLPINCITPRVLELREIEPAIIEKQCECVDLKTGRPSIFWRLTKEGVNFNG